jgi:hypothetical protein
MERISIPEEDSLTRRSGHSALGTFYDKNLHHQRILSHQSSIPSTAQRSNLAHYLEIEPLAEGFNIYVAYGTKPYPHLGQLKEKRFYWALNLSSLYATGGINGTSNESMSFQLGTLGQGGNYNEENKPTPITSSNL